MIKKITMLIFLILFSVTISLGQMASLENKTAFPNTTTTVAINVANFTNINSLTFKISYNPDALDFAGLSNQALAGMLANATGSVITITWTSTTSQSVSNVLCNLNFLYKGTSAPLAFLPGCEVTHGAIPFNIAYSNGSVSPASCLVADAHASIQSTSCGVGDYFTLPVDLSNFPNVGAFTQRIHFDGNRFTFVSITTGGNLNGAIASLDNGDIVIVWSSNPAVNINTVPASSNKLKLNFQCNLPGTSSVSFAPGCVFTAGLPSLANVNVCYANASLTQTATTETAVLGSLNSVVQGDNIEIPLNLNLSVPVSAFTLNLSYNATVLNYTGIEAVDPNSGNSFVQAGNPSAGVLNIVYSNLSPVAFAPGTFFKIKFHYKGVGAGFVNFGGSSQFVDNLLQPINVALTNSTIVPGVYPPNATVTIGTVAANYNEIVDVPVNIDGANSNPIGAATMFIGYDQSKLSFIGAVNNYYNATVGNTNDQIIIAWDDVTGVNLNGTFLNLRFQYHGGGGSGCGSELYFRNNAIAEPCELSMTNGTVAPSNWVNGGVNLNPSQPVITGPANPGFNSTVAYSTDAGMLNYSWQVTGGSIVSGAGTNAISVTWGAAGAGSVSVSYYTSGSCMLSSVKQVTILSGNPTTTIKGYITYDNPSSQGMNGVYITLFNSMGAQVGPTVITNTNVTHGYYQFNNVPQDAYTMSVFCIAPWAGVPGVSATDALLVELQTAGLLNPPLAGIRYSAGDVNGSSTINATDALLIKKRIIGDISYFPIGDWVFNNGIINAFASPTLYSFKALCTGDVNGSYSPVIGAKSAPVLSVGNDGVQYIRENETFTYDILCGNDIQIGAMTMFLNYDQDLFEITGIEKGYQGLEYSIKGGTVSIAWSDPNGKVFKNNDGLISLTIRAKHAVASPVDVFNLTSGSEFAGPLANILDDVKLKMSKVVSGADKFSVSVSPNPFRTTTSFNYSVPEDGKVRLVISNLVGKEICKLLDETVSKGSHSVVLDAMKYNLAPGIYLGKLEFESQNTSTSEVRKIILTR